MNTIIKTELQMLAFVKKNFKYLVVYPDKSYHYFKSLREIKNNIGVDSSTISKKLGNKDSCICIAKDTNYVFWIKKLI